MEGDETDDGDEDCSHCLHLVGEDPLLLGWGGGGGGGGLLEPIVDPTKLGHGMG